MLNQVQPNEQFFNFQGMVTAIKKTHPPAQNGGIKQDVTVWDGSESKDVAYWADPAKGKPLIASVDINIEKSYSIKGVVKGQYTNWTLYLSQFPQAIVGIAAPQAPQGGNQAHEKPIKDAMAGSGVSFGAPPIGTPLPQDIPSQAASQPVQQAPVKYATGNPTGVMQPPVIPPKADPDWDEIARGKVRCNLICALLQNSAYDAGMTEETQQLANNYMNYIFTGQVGMAEPPFNDQIDYQGS